MYLASWELHLHENESIASGTSTNHFLCINTDILGMDMAVKKSKQKVSMFRVK